MIQKVAHRYLVAKTIESLLAGTSRKVLERASALSVKESQGGVFLVSGGKDTHTVKTQRQGVDIKVSCSCNAWVFQGSEYYAHERDYLLGTPRGNLAPPTKRDKQGINLLCKHAVAVFQKIQTPIRMARREDILQEISNQMCSDPSKWDNVVSVIEYDKTLDFPTEDEILISEALHKNNSEHKLSYRYPFPNALDYLGSSLKTFISFTEHASTRAISRGYSTKKIADILHKYITSKDPKKFVRKVQKQIKKGKAIYLGLGGVTIVFVLSKVQNILRGESTLDPIRNSLGDISYDEASKKFVLGKNVHFRVRTVFDSKNDIGEPLGESGASEYTFCELESAIPYDTHTKGKTIPNYEWSARFGTMVARVTDQWLSDNSPIK